MKITRKAQKIQTAWITIPCGAIFDFNGEVFIKIDEIWNGDEFWNAVLLTNGGLANFDKDCFVYLVNAELIVTE